MPSDSRLPSVNDSLYLLLWACRYGAERHGRPGGNGRLMQTAPNLGSSDSDSTSIDWGASESSQPVRLSPVHLMYSEWRTLHQCSKLPMTSTALHKGWA
jgi:hypothetical protein